MRLRIEAEVDDDHASWFEELMHLAAMDLATHLQRRMLYYTVWLQDERYRSMAMHEKRAPDAPAVEQETKQG